MKIGLGVTALNNSRFSGRRDGISTYSASLRAEMLRQFPNHAFVDAPFARRGAMRGTPLRHYEVNAVASALLGVRYTPEMLFSDNLDLFHALDHFIPKMTIPVVATIHDVGPLSHPQLWPQRFRYWKNHLFRAKCRFPTKIIAVSEFTAVEISRHVGISTRDIEVIYEGISDYILNESLNSLNWDYIEQKFQLKPGYIVYCGSVAEKKNIGRLLIAHGGLPIELKRRHPLVLIGGVPAKEQASAVLEGIRRGEAERCVKWLGTLSDEDSAKVVHHSELMVFPSLHEGFGLPVVEAFQLGVPVMTSNVGALPEISGGAAALMNPLDIQEMSHLLQQLLADRGRRRELVARGKERTSEFSWKKCSRFTFEVYERVLR